jgi:expansin (peptidoglycan-binding protein)
VTAYSTRWLATGGAVVLAGVVGVALVLQHGGSACAAPPGNSTSSGKATFYDLGGGIGNCSFPGAPADDLFVALGPSQYAKAASCGSYLDVTGPKGKVRVKVIDSCPGCEVGHLDLSRTAFKKIADEVQGVVSITYRTVVNPLTPGRLNVRLQEGASQYWFSALIDNHGNRLASVRVASSGGSFHAAKRADYNYWVIDGGAGSGPFTIKITDVDGHLATVTGIKLSPGKTQQTSVRLTSSTVTAPKTTTKKQPSPSASPVASASTSSVAPPRLESTGVTEVPTEPAVRLAAGAPRSCH